MTMQSVLDLGVEHLGLDARACNAINDEGLTTIGQVAARSRQEWLRCPNVGPKTVAVIQAALKEHGLSLGVADRIPAIQIQGFRSLAEFPPGVAVVGLTTFRDGLFVALSTGVYELVDDELVPLKFRDIPVEENP